MTYVRIYTSIFESNSAGGSGGAIYGHDANVEIHDTTFESHTAHEGGAIYAYRSDAKIYDSTFQSSTTTGTVSNSIAVLRNFLENFAPIPVGGLPTTVGRSY
jgi:predicted outer membrane repeat protein